MRLVRVLLAGLAAASLLSCGAGGANVPSSPAPAPPSTTPPEPPPRACDDVQLVAEVFDSAGRPFSVGEVTLRSPDPETAIDILGPYTVVVPDGGENLDRPGLRPTVGLFVSGLGFERLPEGGLHQTFRVNWQGSLSLRAETPGCPSTTVTCTAAGCTTSG